MKGSELKCLASGNLHGIISIEVATSDLEGQIVAVLETKDATTKDSAYAYLASSGSLEDSKIPLEYYKVTKQITFRTQLIKDVQGKYLLESVFMCDPYLSPTECPEQAKEIVKGIEPVTCVKESII